MVGEVTPSYAFTVCPPGSLLCTGWQSRPEGGPRLRAVWAGRWAGGGGATADGTGLHALPCEAKEERAPGPVGPHGLKEAIRIDLATKGPCSIQVMPHP